MGPKQIGLQLKILAALFSYKDQVCAQKKDFILRSEQKHSSLSDPLEFCDALKHFECITLKA